MMTILVVLTLYTAALFSGAPTPAPTSTLPPVGSPATAQRERFCRKVVESIPEVCAAPPEDMGGCAEFRSALCRPHKGEGW